MGGIRRGEIGKVDMKMLMMINMIMNSMDSSIMEERDRVNMGLHRDKSRDRVKVKGMKADTLGRVDV